MLEQTDSSTGETSPSQHWPIDARRSLKCIEQNAGECDKKKIAKIIIIISGYVPNDLYVNFL